MGIDKHLAVVYYNNIEIKRNKAKVKQDIVYISVFFCPVSRTLTISIFGESFDANWHRFGEYKTKTKIRFIGYRNILKAMLSLESQT